MTEKYDLNVYITHFVPPKPTIFNLIKSFIAPRFSFAYLRSWARLLKHGTRGNQPWKKDIMTESRKTDQINRKVYLSQLLQSLSKIKVRKLTVNIFTNSEEAKNEILSMGFAIDLNFFVYTKYNKMNHLHNSPWIENDPQSPWNLVWEHKELLRADFLKGSKTSLFLYIENDMLFSQQNLDYWISNRSKLADYGLLPSFMIVEYADNLDSWVAINQFEFEHSPSDHYPGVVIGKQRFVQLPNTYSAMYLMDMQLVREYLDSPAFQRETSRDLIWWDLGARASMGVQFINVPEGFTSRHVIELNNGVISKGALVHHLPNLYSKKLQQSDEFTQIENFFKTDQ